MLLRASTATICCLLSICCMLGCCLIAAWVWCLGCSVRRQPVGCTILITIISLWQCRARHANARSGEEKMYPCCFGIVTERLGVHTKGDCRLPRHLR